MKFLSNMLRKKQEKIAILDDLYPHPISRGTWRGVEFETYLEHFPSLKIYTNLYSKHLVDSLSSEDIFAAFRKSASAEWNRRVYHVDSFDIRIGAPDLFYFLFLNNAYLSLPTINRYKKPFLFTLYPGGGFARFNEESDSKLRAITSSPYFKGVIATSTVTRDYLTEGDFCADSQVTTLFGGIFPEHYLHTEDYQKCRFGIGKPTLDIVFSANRYTDHGEDKGYDIFIKIAHMLIASNLNAHFHVVGNYDETILDVSALKSRIHFYGIQLSSFFAEFYYDKDLIISPNRPDVLAPGAFDGFPTGSVVDAIIRKTAAFCTDLAGSGQNAGQYEEGKEIEIIGLNVDEIYSLILRYYESPEQLAALGETGAAKARSLYSAKRQLAPRITLLEETLHNIR